MTFELQENLYLKCLKKQGSGEQHHHTNAVYCPPVRESQPGRELCPALRSLCLRPLSLTFLPAALGAAYARRAVTSLSYSGRLKVGWDRGLENTTRRHSSV